MLTGGRYLTNLRQELLEERASLRLLKKSIKRRRKAHDDRHGRRTGDSVDLDLDEAALKTMGDAVRSFTKTFQEIERPFLEHGEDGIQQATRRRSRRRGQSSSPYYAHSAYQSPQADHEKRAHGSDDEPDDDKFWPQRVNYCNFTLRCRFAWLSRKSQAQMLFDQLSRLQTRRIARQVSGIGVAVHEYGEKMSDLEDALDRIEDRMHRIGKYIERH